jgi:hypothetical protein
VQHLLQRSHGEQDQQRAHRKRLASSIAGAGGSARVAVAVRADVAGRWGLRRRLAPQPPPTHVERQVAHGYAAAATGRTIERPLRLSLCSCSCDAPHALRDTHPRIRNALCAFRDTCPSFSSLVRRAPPIKSSHQ